MNIADALDRNRTFFPDRDAMVYCGTTWSYGQLWEEANRVANALAALGVRREDKVCVFLSNRPEFILTYYACQKLGALCVSLSSMSKAHEVEYMANDSEGVVLVCEDSLMNEVPARSAIPGVRAVIDVDGTRGDRTWAD
ncbi:MAG: AMP-binding protein, partial [Deltaproteobacteria bacterium]|nr:AMP-binding protein [Deltaproteobacteria bacterium]